MPRRIGLKSIASGMAGSFISRNNDVGGFWAIGKLWKLAKDANKTKVLINLNYLSIDPPSMEFGTMMERYREMMEASTLRQAFDPTWLKEASIQVDFHPDEKKVNLVRPPYDEIGFSVRVQIKSDLGKIYEASSNGFCGPHNPDYEQRSTRYEKPGFDF
jgi:hypothetical protein